MRIPRTSKWTGEKITRLRYYVSQVRPDLGTQRMFSAFLGLSESHYKSLENDRHTPGPTTAAKLDKAGARFHVMAQVFGDQEAPIRGGREDSGHKKK